MYFVTGPSNQCEVKTVRIKINSQQWEWKQAYSNRASIEFKMLESNLISLVSYMYLYLISSDY